METQRFVVILSGLLLAPLAALSLGIGNTGAPTIASPYPLPLVIAAFAGVPPLLVALSVSAAFFAWSYPLFRGESGIPLRSTILFLVVAAGSVWFFATGWEYGLKYQGHVYTATCASLSTIQFAVLTTARLLNRRSERFWTSLGFHVGLFAWIATYAMPYLGETP